MSIVVEAVSRNFYDRDRGDFTAVDNVSFDCRPHEILGLLGPNGAGKSTMLRMIATLLRPHEGRILVNGHDVRKSPEEARKSLGFLSAETRLYNKLTPAEILSCFARMSGLSDSDSSRRINDIIEALGMERFRNVRCEKLSTGMKQKVAIARAIVHDPPVICLDEPTTGLDVLAASSTNEFIKSARSQGKCVLFSTHNMYEAEKLCDRIAVIHRGKLLAIGTLEELRKQEGRHYLEDIFIALVQEKTGEII